MCFLELENGMSIDIRRALWGYSILNDLVMSEKFLDIQKTEFHTGIISWIIYPTEKAFFFDISCEDRNYCRVRLSNPTIHLMFY
jgi:hypothetical protein